MQSLMIPIVIPDLRSSSLSMEAIEALRKRSRRFLKVELFRELDHAKHSNFKDILNHLDYSHRVVKELLDRAKKYQKRDLEKAKR